MSTFSDLVSKYYYLLIFVYPLEMSEKKLNHSSVLIVFLTYLLLRNKSKEILSANCEYIHSNLNLNETFQFDFVWNWYKYFFRNSLLLFLIIIFILSTRKHREIFRKYWILFRIYWWKIDRKCEQQHVHIIITINEWLIIIIMYNCIVY